ncbi:MAG: hypothetical protein M1358_25285 [Chloroflexi bacterium]|nr:hypothetical protein [Chloroflexota bacterium]
MTHTFELVDEYHGVAMWRRDDGKFAITCIDRNAGQVYSYLRSDKPAQPSTNWFAAISDCGIDYVAGAYSESYIRHQFKRWKSEYDHEDSDYPDYAAEYIALASQGKED